MREKLTKSRARYKRNEEKGEGEREKTNTGRGESLFFSLHLFRITSLYPTLCDMLSENFKSNNNKAVENMILT